MSEVHHSPALQKTLKESRRQRSEKDWRNKKTHLRINDLWDPGCGQNMALRCPGSSGELG